MIRPLVSIILPIHNQADHVEAVVEQYLTELEKLPNPYEVLLVVNASTDRSFVVCQGIASRRSMVRVLETPRGGWGLAVKMGIVEAAGDLICYTNSARTTPQDLVLCLLYAVSYGAVVVKANRKIRERWTRRLGSLLYNVQCRTLFDLSNWDVNGTPKVFPRAFGKLLELTHDDDLIDAEFCLACRRQEYPMIEIPTFSARRHGGRSTTRYGSALRMYAGALKLWRERRAA